MLERFALISSNIENLIHIIEFRMAYSYLNNKVVDIFVLIVDS